MKKIHTDMRDSKDQINQRGFLIVIRDQYQM